jgi:hypothetical protein
VNQVTELKQEDLRALRDQVRTEYEEFRARGLALDMTRGKPSPEQLDLANHLLALPGSRDYLTKAGDDARNYGVLQGLPEVRALFSKTLGAGAGRWSRTHPGRGNLALWAGSARPHSASCPHLSAFAGRRRRLGRDRHLHPAGSH